ncbi:hypothetical protein [Allokutzneria oryzae]|uniref:Uncharacterized protein n=1 Tax=Allokutzneria oryzae TaxID=1378989 RepID=A0ABV6A4V7_9PSEU
MRQVEPGSGPTADELIRRMRDSPQEWLAKRLAEAMAADPRATAAIPMPRGATHLS